MAMEKSAVARAGEIDHGIVMRTLKQIAVDHLDLTRRCAQQSEIVPGHRHHILHRLQPGVIPDRRRRRRPRPTASACRPDRSVCPGRRRRDIWERAGRGLRAGRRAARSLPAEAWPPGSEQLLLRMQPVKQIRCPAEGFVADVRAVFNRSGIRLVLGKCVMASVQIGQTASALDKSTRRSSLRRMGASGKFDQRDHIGLDVVGDFRIGLQLGQGSRARHRLAVRLKAFGVQAPAPPARCATPRRCRRLPTCSRADPETRRRRRDPVRILNDGDVMCHGEPQSGFQPAPL